MLVKTRNDDCYYKNKHTSMTGVYNCSPSLLMVCFQRTSEKKSCNLNILFLYSLVRGFHVVLNLALNWSKRMNICLFRPPQLRQIYKYVVKSFSWLLKGERGHLAKIALCCMIIFPALFSNLVVTHLKSPWFENKGTIISTKSQLSQLIL